MEGAEMVNAVAKEELNGMFNEILDLHADIESIRHESLKDGAFRAGRVVAVNPDREIAMLAPLRTDDATGKQVPDYSDSPIVASTTRCHVTLGTNAGVVRSAGSWVVTCSEDHLPCISGVAP